MAQDDLLKSPNPPSSEPGAVLLETERLIIRRFLPSDAADMAKEANDPEIVQNMRNGFPSPYTIADAERHIDMNLELYKDGTGYPHAVSIYTKPTHAGEEPVFVGGCRSVANKDVYYRGWELGYWIAKPAWGQGYATEAITAFTRWIFETWPQLNRLEGATYSRNLASQRVLKKCGFTEEGRRRQAVEKNGMVLDEVIFGLVRSDLE